MASSKVNIPPNKKMAAVCGLFCPACIVYIAAREPDDRRRKIAQSLGLEADSLQCDGCRSDRRFAYCRTCKVTACAKSRGIEFCGSCSEYPCDDLKEFQNAYPHRLELWDSLARIASAGYETWFAEMAARFSCPACGTINSAYHLACRACGHRPGSAFVAAHAAEISGFPRFHGKKKKESASRPAKSPRREKKGLRKKT